MTKFKNGDRVKFVQVVDNYPHVLVKVGETGTFMSVDEEGSYCVLLDRQVPDLEEWQNQVCIWDWSKEQPEAPSPEEHIILI